MECEIINLQIHPELKQQFIEYAIGCPGIDSFATLADWIKDDLLEDSESVLIAINEGKISQKAYECYQKLSEESIFKKERYYK